MLEDKREIIQLLTGVKSSKRNYYHELKKNLQKIEKQNMQLAIINQVVKSFNVDTSMDDMLHNVMDKLTKIFSFDRLALALVESEELVVSNVYPKQYAALPAGTFLSKANSLYQMTIHQQKAIRCPISELSANDEQVFQCQGIAQMLYVPLFSKHRPIGVLSFGDTALAEYDYSDLTFLQQLADQLAVCIENARLYNAVLHGKREWEKTFSAVTDLLLYVDMDTRILRFNQAVSAFVGLAEEQIYNRTFCELFQGTSDPLAPCPIKESYQTKQTAYHQLPLVGNRICDVFSYPVFNEQKEMYAAILYIKDVTKKLHIEAQLIQSGKLAAIGEMAAGVAHELNNPLTAILGNTQLLLRECETDGEKGLLEDILLCGKRCRSIIQNLLTFSRQDDYTFSECSLNLVVEQVLSLVRYQIERSGICISVELAAALPPFEGSIQQIEQILLNLLLNAKDAVSENENKAKQIFLCTEEVMQPNGTSMLCLHVRDNGKGIPDKHKEDIFHPFFTTKEAQKGTGLGLSVSLGIARAHQGRIEVQSQMDGGSQFTLMLPAVIEQSES
ncbi:ATP-binding protein [Aneurinibacillus sp. REN35]|uniref:ATP-binding protein n=1 Tax=Aneurinibacillus sp. REN35 TaxID=3237286 RepID=UPI00352902FF